MSTGSTPSTVSDNVGSQAAHPPRQNELPCFISQKSMVMTVDDIGKICTCKDDCLVPPFLIMHLQVGNGPWRRRNIGTRNKNKQPAICG